MRPQLARAAAAALAALLLSATLGATLGAMPSQRHAVAPTPVAHAAAREALAPLTGQHARPAAPLPHGALPLDATVPGRAPLRANGGPPGDFPFQTTQSADGLIVIHSYGQYPSFGSDFVAEAQQALRERVQPGLGYGLRARVDIYIYNSRADFLAGAEPDAPEITGAYSTYRPFQIFMPAIYDYADEFDLLSHELTHITFHQTVDVGHLVLDYRLFPNWFDEGLAVSDESTTSPGYGLYRAGLMQSVRNGGRYLDLFSQFVWTHPQDPDANDLAYAEAGAFLTYLSTTAGADRFHQFIADITNGDLNSACVMDFGADLRTLESQWEVTLGKPALPQASGVAPSQTTVTPYSPKHEPALLARTRPYGVGGGDDTLLTALIEAGAGTAATLVALLAAALWLWLRRRRWRARQAALIAAPAAGVASAPGAAPAHTAIVTELPTADAPTEVASPSAAEAPSADVAAAAPGAPSVSAPANAPTAPAASMPMPRGTPWLEQVALALAVPLALGVGLLWLLLDPARLWRHAALAGAGAALPLAVAVGVLAWRTWRKGWRNLVAHGVTLGVLLALAALTATQTAGDAGLAQARGYEHDSAFALALAAFADTGAPAATLARTHAAWADSAYYTSDDYAAATAQYRAAIALAGPGKASRANRATLLKLTLEWGKRLSDAHAFAQAAQVYAAQLGSPSCDTSCQTSVQEQGGGVYLAWAADLIAQKQPDAALAQLRALQRSFPKSKAAASAQLTLAQESQGLAGAWAARKAGDSAAMNLLLALLEVRTTDPQQAALAAEAPQPVSGTLGSTYLATGRVHMYWLAFHSAADAKAFTSTPNLYPDASLFKVTTQTDDQGNFTVWLVPGYSYLPLWEAPPKGGVDGYFWYSRTIVTVTPFTAYKFPYLLAV
ncbi:MAG TPA: hypothetical protein VGR57_20620 [Ktedonobacterales bacterium]|nr:hypothetical protein [Ktedonobacterales bacterium]